MGPAAQKTGALQDFSVSHQVSKATLQTAFLLPQTAFFCATARPDKGSEGLAKAQPKPRLATEQRQRSAATAQWPARLFSAAQQLAVHCGAIERVGRSVEFGACGFDRFGEARVLRALVAVDKSGDIPGFLLGQ